MSTSLKILILIALCGANVFLFLSTFKGNRKKAVVPVDRTVIIPYLYLDQLDPENLNRVSRTYNLTRELLSGYGVRISRAGCSVGDIFLECAFNATATVGEDHAVVAMDEHGCYIQNNHEDNGMQLLIGNQKVPADEVEIDDGTIIYLGLQPVRFRYPNIQPAEKHSLWKKVLQITRLLLGNLRGFSEQNSRHRANHDKQRRDW